MELYNRKVFIECNKCGKIFDLHEWFRFEPGKQTHLIKELRKEYELRFVSNLVDCPKCKKELFIPHCEFHLCENKLKSKVLKFFYRLFPNLIPVEK